MSENIRFNGYSAPAKSKTSLNLTVGIFFDGTLNNKTNVEEGIHNTDAYKKNGASKKKDTSYYNDKSNVARLWEFYADKNKIYVEGIGTNDRQKDQKLGYAFGTGETGIRGKVRKGCSKIVEIIKREKNRAGASKVQILTLDVYGFSRGAAAARNFVYEIHKPKYNPLLKVYPNRGNIRTDYTDSDGNLTTRKHFPRRGHLGLLLEENNIQVDVIKVRFLGIFDTVSSYSKNIAVPPNFNDVKELSLNEITAAKTVFHLVAENEHRENFSLTRTRVGIEKTLPGAHSDVGGGYTRGLETVAEIETSFTTKNKLKPLIKTLIDEGWYKEDELEITGGNLYWALTGTRVIEKSYSFIPLHFMAEKSNSSSAKVNRSRLESMYAMSGNELLVRVKAKLRKYVFGNGKEYRLDHTLTKQERADLLHLRNKYLHWSANRAGIGMDPNKNRKRVFY